MSAEFGQLIRAAMQDKGLSQGKVAALVGLYDGDRYLDATQVRLLMTGERKPTRGLVQRLVEVLDLDPPEAWAAAGLLPPGVTADMLRRLDVFALVKAGVGASTVTQQYARSPAYAPRMGVLIPFPVERRQHDRRRAKPHRRKVVVADVVRVDRMVASR